MTGIASEEEVEKPNSRLPGSVSAKAEIVHVVEPAAKECRRSSVSAGASRRECRWESWPDLPQAASDSLAVEWQAS
jgi:hypothetical protein